MSAPVPVIQADREAAVAFYIATGRYFNAHVEDGTEDDTPIVQALARHRLAHTPAAVDDAGVVERRKAVAVELAGHFANCPWADMARDRGHLKSLVRYDAGRTINDVTHDDCFAAADGVIAALAAIPQARDVTRDIPDGWRDATEQERERCLGIVRSSQLYFRDFAVANGCEDALAEACEIACADIAAKILLAAAPAPPATAGGASDRGEGA